MGLTAAQQQIHDLVFAEFTEDVDFRYLGGRVMWINRGSRLVRRYIAGTNTLSQHVGGNAEDFGTINSTDPAAIQKIDRLVARVMQARDEGMPVGRILWRGVANHYPHHAHIEGFPPMTQAQLWAEYEEMETENMTVAELVEKIQGALVAAGYNLGTYGPNKNGVDGDWGAKTDQAFKAAMESAANPLAVIPDLSAYAKVTHTHRIIGGDDLITGVPV